MGIVNKDDFAAKHIVPAERFGISLARKWKVPDVEEFAAIAVYELGLSIVQADDPSWEIIKLRIHDRLKVAADKYHEEQKKRAEFREDQERRTHGN